MADTLTCEIVTPVKTVFSSEVTYVGLPGEMGSFGVMQRHEPLASALKAGAVNVTVAGEDKASKLNFVVSGGYAEISDNKVIVLANDALAVSEIEVPSVKAELAKVEQAIAGLKEGDSSAAYYMGQKVWFELQLKVASGE